MPSLPTWSTTSDSSRPELAQEVFLWRPSRQQQGLMALLVAAAAAALLLCELPATAALPAAVAVLVRGLWLLRRERGKTPVRIELSPEGASVDGEAVTGLVVAWRGPLAFMRWRSPPGRLERRVWWPDVMPPESRRRLRLATGQETSSPVVASVAP